MNNKDITNSELLESINRSFSNVEKRFTTDITSLELKLTTEIRDLRMDLKSFKKETKDTTDTQDADITDLNDTTMLHDKRIEKPENKVFT